jgi:hypothetical protein
MHLLLGHPHDPCCASVRSALGALGCESRIVANPFAHPARLSWRLDTDRSESRLAWDEDAALGDDAIEGVLVRDVGWVDPAGWQPADLAYAQAETQAALLGWLWSLRCPVVNRYPAATWYRPQLSILAWRSTLVRCGLPAPEAIVTNDDDEARAFGRRVATAEASGVVYRPLTSDTSYLIADDRDWRGLAAMQRRAPVHLTGPHARPHSACVVGESVVWDDAPPPRIAALREALEPALLRFAAAARLTFVEIVLADVAGAPCVVAVEHHPRFERFGEAARDAIVAALAHLLTAGRAARGALAPSASARHA